jgi:hypothetical protein
MTMISPAPTVSMAATAPVVNPRPWERLCAWLVLVGAMVPAAFVFLLAAIEPRQFWASVASGAVPWYSLLLPVLHISGVVLLVRMHRWSFPLLATHLVLSFAYLVSRHGAAALSALDMLGFGLKGLAVVFSSYLGRTGKLR